MVANKSIYRVIELSRLGESWPIALIVVVAVALITAEECSGTSKTVLPSNMNGLLFDWLSTSTRFESAPKWAYLPAKNRFWGINFACYSSSERMRASNSKWVRASPSSAFFLRLEQWRITMTQTTVEIARNPPTPKPTPTPRLVRAFLSNGIFEAAAADSDAAVAENNACNDAIKLETAGSGDVAVSVADPILVSISAMVFVEEMRLIEDARLVEDTRLVAVGNRLKSSLTVWPTSGFCTHAAFNALTSRFSSVRTSNPIL